MTRTAFIRGALVAGTLCASPATAAEVTPPYFSAARFMGMPESLAAKAPVSSRDAHSFLFRSPPKMLRCPAMSDETAPKLRLKPRLSADPASSTPAPAQPVPAESAPAAPSSPAPAPAAPAAPAAEAPKLVRLRPKMAAPASAEAASASEVGAEQNAEG